MRGTLVEKEEGGGAEKEDTKEGRVVSNTLSWVY